MKIAINAGHTISGAGYGATSNGFHESNITREIAGELIQILRKHGHTVTNATVNRASSQNAYLKEVCRLANKSGADIFVSIHLNAANGSGHGCEVYTWRGANVPSARSICKNLSALGYKNRGVKDGSGLYVIKHTTMTAILVEVFFLDNETDRNLYIKHGAQKIAEAIAKGLN